MEYVKSNNNKINDTSCLEDNEEQEHFSNDEKKSIICDIERLSILEQKEILKIIIEDEVKYSENQHGTFTNFNLFKDTTIAKIVDFIKFCENNRELFREREKEETEIEQNILIKKYIVEEKQKKQLKPLKKEIIKNVVLKKEKSMYSSHQERILKIFKNNNKKSSRKKLFKIKKNMKIDDEEEDEEVEEEVEEEIEEEENEEENEEDNGDYMINEIDEESDNEENDDNYELDDD